MICDGNIVVFILQGRSTNKKTKNEWFNPSFDRFGYPPGFNNSNEYWQRTGIHGTFDEDEGLAALRLFSVEHTEYDWRLMRLHIIQEHTEVACFWAKTPGKKPPDYYPIPDEMLRRYRAIAGN